MKVAIVHDWLVGMRGGERCLEVFCELFPDATVFTLVHKKGSVSETIERMDIRTSFIQKLPCATTLYRQYLPLFPKAVESFDLSRYDLVLSSSHCAAKGVKVPAGIVHVCYCYTPMRYAWLLFDDYFGNQPRILRWLISKILQGLKRWDLRTNQTVDFFVAISDKVRQRIVQWYNRHADVIYPPVDVSRFTVTTSNDGYYLIVSALVPYKKIDIAVQAFNILGDKLVIIGKGDQEEQLKKKAAGNIEFLGWLSDSQIASYYASCRAIIFPGIEDFGIVPVEAQACGKPVIAFGRGGACETVIPADKGIHSDFSRATGVFFPEQNAGSLIEAIKYFETIEKRFEPRVLRRNAERFSREKFKDAVKTYIEKRCNAKKT